MKYDLTLISDYHTDPYFQHRREAYAQIKEKLEKSRPEGTNWSVDFGSFVKGWDAAFQYIHGKKND